MLSTAIRVRVRGWSCERVFALTAVLGQQIGENHRKGGEMLLTTERGCTVPCYYKLLGYNIVSYSSTNLLELSQPKPFVFGKCVMSFAFAFFIRVLSYSLK